MKIKKSEFKTLKHAYLYADGHMVLSHEKRDRDAGNVRWVTIYENVGIKPLFGGKGRLIIDKGALSFCLHATAIKAEEKSWDRGSDNTKKAGIAVETVILYNGNDRGFIISSFPDMISSDLKYQPETSEKFEDVKNIFTWGFETVKAVYSEPVSSLA